MATRMQQRRGTEATWTSANPILAPGEIGFEIDTNRFKIGDGTNRWANLTYFTADAAAALEGLIDGAPGLLDTLNELAAAINDDPNFFATVATNLSNHESDTTNVHGIADTSLLATKSYADQAEADAISAAAADATTKSDAAKADAKSYTDAREIAITTAYESYADQAEADAKAYADQKVADLVDSAPEALNTLNELAEALGDDSNFATTVSTNIGTKVSKAGDTMTGALTLSGAPTSNLHAATKAYVDTAKSDANAYTDSEISDLNSSVNDSLALKAPLASPTFTGTVSGITKSMVGLANVDNTSDANKPISTATQSALDLKAPLNSPTFTGTVSGVTKSMVGLGNVDNTSDADKPVSTATQSALDLKAPLASPELTGVPTAPTAALGTNTTQVATTEFVDAAIEALASRNLILDGGAV